MPYPRRWLFALLTLGALALPVEGTAQASLGLSAGAAFANFTADDLDFIDTNTGFLGGAYLAFPLSDFFSIAPGLYYVQKGSRIQIPLEGVSLKVDWDLAYLEVPVLGVFNVTGADRPVGVSLFLGPSVAFEVSCTTSSGFVSDEGEEEMHSGDCDGEEDGEPLVEREKKMDVGAIFGAGLAFPLAGGVDVTLNGGLDMALTSIDQHRFVEVVRSGNDEPLRPGEGDVKNTAWFLTGGLRFPLGG